MDTTVWVPRQQEIKSAPNFVIKQIREALFDRKLKPGDRLPSETELGELFGVSRGSIRQAMKSLEMLGILTIRPGDGTYINDSVSENSMNPLAFALLISRPSIKMMADARYALERDIFELILADEERVEKVIPLLEDNINARKEMIKNNASAEELVKNDQDFHLILSKACGNLVLQIVYDYIMDSFRQYLLNTASQKTFASKDKTARDHTAILEGLRARNYSEVKLASKMSMSAWTDSIVMEDRHSD